MRILRCLFVPLLSLLIGGSASAQDAKGWLGADVLDVTKAEADKLGWDIPPGAKVGLVASGSPADKAGLKPGGIVRAMDGVEIVTSGAFEKAIGTKTPGAQTSLLVLSAGRKRHVAVTLAELPKAQAVLDQGEPSLMLDTGGHIAGHKASGSSMGTSCLDVGATRTGPSCP
jgi:predicted metalloprotease with PDZ domain